MILYTCGTKKMGPGFAHPCAKAGKALDAAGYEYELKTVGGYRLMPWTWGSRDEDRAEIKKLSGTNEVPILVLDDGRSSPVPARSRAGPTSTPTRRPSPALSRPPRAGRDKPRLEATRTPIRPAPMRIIVCCIP